MMIRMIRVSLTNLLFAWLLVLLLGRDLLGDNQPLRHRFVIPHLHHPIEEKPFKAAVCISGQLGRLYLSGVLSGLIEPNSQFDFTVFLSLQTGEKTTHNTRDMHPQERDVFVENDLVNLSVEDIISNLTALLFTTNSHLGGYDFHQDKNRSEWEELLR